MPRDGAIVIALAALGHGIELVNRYYVPDDRAQSVIDDTGRRRERYRGSFEVERSLSGRVLDQVGLVRKWYGARSLGTLDHERYAFINVHQPILLSGC
jgi:hypothetical protein